MSPYDVACRRGEIHDGEVVKTHEEALEEENAEATAAEEREDLEPADEEPPGEYENGDRENLPRSGTSTTTRKLATPMRSMRIPTKS